MKIRNITLMAVMLIINLDVFAHPTGNMITVGENILWSYINPIDDPNHYACVMIWTNGSEPEVLVQSEYAASDFMLSKNQNTIYIIERRYFQASNDFEIRVLKSTIGTEPTILWDWFKDDHRIGEGGFFMLSDNQMIFGNYPEIYRLNKGEEPQKYFEFNQPIKRIRAVENNRILLLGDNSCYLVQQNGSILKQWNELIDNSIENAPLDRNHIFDVDYSNGELLLSYWGRRSFDLIDTSGIRLVLLQQSEPFTPHWVAFWNNEKLLFSSKLIFDGSTPKPHLILINEQNRQVVLWSTVEVGLETIDKNRNSVKLYPNPTQDFISIDWVNFERATVSELSGKELFASVSRFLDLRTLSAGVYLITLDGPNNEQITFRVIKN